MELGVFSISLAVKDLEKSKIFYEKLGFTKFGGEQEQNWLIMKNGPQIIGLFQGMFEGNILTFNPGWDENANTLDSFTDIREIHKSLKAQDVEMTQETVSTERGPASFSLTDPDGNSILIDQHI